MDYHASHLNQTYTITFYIQQVCPADILLAFWNIIMRKMQKLWETLIAFAEKAKIGIVKKLIKRNETHI